MNGVAVGPNELKISNFILLVPRRGEFVANTPESHSWLCCKIGMLDFGVQHFWEHMESVPTIPKHVNFYF